MPFDSAPAALVAEPQTPRDWASIADRAFSFLAGALLGVLVAVVLIMGVR